MSLNLWISILDKWSSIFVDENCFFLFSWLQFSFLSVIIALKPRQQKNNNNKNNNNSNNNNNMQRFVQTISSNHGVRKTVDAAADVWTLYKASKPWDELQVKSFLKQFIVRLITFKNSEPRVKNKRLNDLGRFQKTDGPHTCQVVSGRAKPSVPLTV